jgi:hypothetical protein
MIKQGYFVPQEKALRNMFSCCGSKGGYFIEGARDIMYGTVYILSLMQATLVKKAEHL